MEMKHASTTYSAANKASKVMRLVVRLRLVSADDRMRFEFIKNSSFSTHMAEQEDNSGKPLAGTDFRNQPYEAGCKA